MMQRMSTYRPMLSAVTVALLGAFLLLPGASAQSIGAQGESGRQAGDPFFHEAAQYYVAEQKQPALQAIQEGLEVAPNHPKLLALRNKIREQMGARPQPGDEGRDGAGQEEAESSDSGKPQAGKGATGQRPPPSSREGSGSDAPGEDGSPQDENREPGEESEDGASETQGEAGSPSRDGPSGSPDAGQGRGDGEGQAGRSARLSRAQAERILDALESQEKQLLREVQKREARPRRVEKDW
ncbi:hypothetical protein [Longibacter sp.]|uniref:hypothetical protein n=1 Tax=Longibacter sp. TaxID=2045415 RepID=UPI003EBC0248